ncbi:hypothetical protein PDE_00560 [Penicillium oxalicum 114-2]|uniref:Uncharacterized protein n=1 Tax=Penicillium oxalicum (strain 114-2 / CGMCC 5302) TaxID=933388 RepID=S7ZAB5_PENO1|nr:hypothetical protein PDE_00560 [Penicillium oxalicum 114-2]
MTMGSLLGKVGGGGTFFFGDSKEQNPEAWSGQPQFPGQGTRSQSFKTGFGPGLNLSHTAFDWSVRPPGPRGGFPEDDSDTCTMEQQ